MPADGADNAIGYVTLNPQVREVPIQEHLNAAVPSKTKQQYCHTWHTPSSSPQAEASRTEVSISKLKEDLH